MSTTTDTTTEVTPKVDTKVATSITAYYSLETKAMEAQEKAEGGLLAIAAEAIPVVKRQGLTKPAQVSEFFRLCFRSQANLLEPMKDEKSVDFEARVAAYVEQTKATVSMLTTLVMPTGSKTITAEEATKGRDMAYAYNASLPAKVKVNTKIGQRPMLDIVRGKILAADAIAIKKGEKPANSVKADTSKPASAAATGSAASTPTETDPNDPATQTATPPNPATQQVAGQGQGAAPVTAGSEGSGVIVGDTDSAIRHQCRTIWPNYVNNLGASKDLVKKVILEELERFMAA